MTKRYRNLRFFKAYVEAFQMVMSDLKYPIETNVNPLPYDVFRGAQPMACGLFGPAEVMTLSVMKTILMM